MNMHMAKGTTSDQRNTSRTASKPVRTISRANQWKKTSVPETVKFEEALHESFLIGVTVTAKFTSQLFKLEGILRGPNDQKKKKKKKVAMIVNILLVITLFISGKEVVLAVAITTTAAASGSSSSRCRRRSRSRHCLHRQSRSGRRSCCVWHGRKIFMLLLLLMTMIKQM